MVFADFYSECVLIESEIIAYLIDNVRAGTDCVENVVLYLGEINSLSAGKHIHEIGAELIGVFCKHGVALIAFLLSRGVNLLCQIQRLFHVGNAIQRRHLLSFRGCLSGVLIVVVLAIIISCSDARSYVRHPGLNRALRHRGFSLCSGILNVNFRQRSALIYFVCVKAPIKVASICLSANIILAELIGHAVADKNKILTICGNRGIVVKQSLTCQKAGVGVCAILKFCLDCFCYLI